MFKRFQRNWINVFILISITACQLSCAGKKPLAETEPDPELPPKILFLNYMIRTNENGSKSIKLINQITAEGKLKDTSEKKAKGTEGDLLCSVQNNENQEIEKFVVENPLKITVEFINDLGNFEKKLITLDSAQFSIRMQLHPKARHIRISEWSDSNVTELIQTKIE